MDPLTFSRLLTELLWQTIFIVEQAFSLPESLSQWADLNASQEIRLYIKLWNTEGIFKLSGLFNQYKYPRRVSQTSKVSVCSALNYPIREITYASILYISKRSFRVFIYGEASPGEGRPVGHMSGTTPWGGVTGGSTCSRWVADVDPGGQVLSGGSPPPIRKVRS